MIETTDTPAASPNSFALSLYLAVRERLKETKQMSLNLKDHKPHKRTHPSETQREGGLGTLLELISIPFLTSVHSNYWDKTHTGSVQHLHTQNGELKKAGFRLPQS